MAPSTAEATLIVLDVTCDPQFFASSIRVTSRIVERKMFSHPNDAFGLILLGCEQTNNNRHFPNVSLAVDLCLPSWDLIELLHDKVKPNACSASDWINSLIVAADYLEDKKFAKYKVVFMSDFNAKTKSNDQTIDSLIQKFKDAKIELIVIGMDIWDDSFKLKSEIQLKNEIILKRILSELDSIACNFDEADSQLQFHKRKSTKAMPWNVQLKIGSNISIPVSGFAKIRDDKSLGAWKKAFKDPQNQKSLESVSYKRSYYKKDDNISVVDDLDIVNGYIYGQIIVPFTKLDKDMEYESGPKCLLLYGFTKNDNIQWNHLTGDGITYVVSQRGDNNAKIALESLIMAMTKLNLVAIVRKVYNKNTAVHMNVLFPIIEQDFMCLSMINLSFKEDYRFITFPLLKQPKFTKEQQQSIDDLIDCMDLSELDEDGNEAYSIENSINPTLQHFFDTLSYRALNPDKPLPKVRSEVLQLLETPSKISKMSQDCIESIKNNFELKTNEKHNSGKRWIEQKLKNNQDQSDENDSVVEDKEINPLSVIASQITTIGTAEPVKDFKVLLNLGEPINVLCEQMKEVIERCVFLTFGSNYSKPVEAMKVLRGECLNLNPKFYNKWLGEFKSVLTARSKIDFFKLVVENGLGLITKAENPEFGAEESEAEALNKIPNNMSMNTEAVDNFDVDNLFDDD